MKYFRQWISYATDAGAYRMEPPPRNEMLDFSDHSVLIALRARARSEVPISVDESCPEDGQIFVALRPEDARKLAHRILDTLENFHKD